MTDVTCYDLNDATQYDAVAEILAHVCELLQTAKVTTAQAYEYAVQALEALTLAIEEYEDVL